MRRCVVALLLALLCVVAPAAPVRAEGTLEVRLIDASADAGPPLANAALTLWKVHGGRREQAGQATADGNGLARFPRLVTGADVTYYCIAQSGSATYVSDVAVFAHDEALLSIDALAYPMAALAEVDETQAHWIITPQPGGLRVQEVHILTLPESRAYVAATGDAPDFAFPLPAAAGNLASVDAFAECCARRTAERLELLLPLYPGAQQLVLAYDIVTGSASYTWVQTTTHPIAKLDLLFAHSGPGLTVTGLQEQPPLVMGETRYLHYSGADISAGRRIELAVAGLTPAPAGATLVPTTAARAPGGSRSLPVLAAMGLGTLLVVALLAYPLLKRRGGSEP